MINRLAIIGVGLIGGSLSLALKAKSAVNEVVGYSRSEDARQQALDLGIIDKAASSLAEAVRDADMVFVAVPMGAMATVFNDIAAHLNPEAIVTDGGSAKGQVVAAAKQAFGDKFKQFVPGHPIAGTEKSGPAAAFATLYQDHRIVLTPVPETDSAATSKVKAMWQLTGAEVFEMDVEHHDIVLAATSHLPHVLAFNLVGMLAERDDCDDVLRYAAGGFRDFSRIASSDAVMWRDICLGNQEAILSLLEQYHQGINLIEEAIRNGDGDYLINVFSRAKKARDSRFADPDLIDNSEV
ncbi:prephenate dehydrogenase [Methylophaga sp.]|uniref:prephenate dehydrogenase n=1 Tax=Methylophaga sp. TaxID=2024840 RepID=UPI003F69804C